MKRRWIIILALISIIVLISSYRNAVIKSAFNDLKEGDHSHMFIEKIGVGLNEHYTVESKADIKLVLDKVANLKMQASKVKAAYGTFISYKGRYDVELRIADDQLPPNYTRLIFLGNDYLQLEIYNEDTKMIDVYRAKVSLTDDQINEIVFGD